MRLLPPYVRLLICVFAVAATLLAHCEPVDALASRLAAKPRAPSKNAAKRKPARKSPKPEVDTVRPGSSEAARIEADVLRLVNEAREANELNPLVTNEAVAAVARDYCRRMAEQGFFSHYGPAGDAPWDRIRAAGLPYEFVGENIYQSRGVPRNRLARTAVEGWLQSKGHRENILREAFTETGIGLWCRGKTCYFTQIFFRPA
jgi:uncharacterized protein YkwD